MKGKIFVISAPSGCGKTTLVNMVLKNHHNAARSITCTTREKRKGEIDGRDYHFLDKKEFEKKIEQKEFLEYATVFGNYYGTLKTDVEKILKENKNAILVIDVQGGLQIKNNRDAIFIFITPPSLEELKKRLIKRDENNNKDLNKRLSCAEKEINIGKLNYDYIVENKDLNMAYNQICAIMEKENKQNEEK